LSFAAMTLPQMSRMAAIGRRRIIRESERMAALGSEVAVAKIAQKDRIRHKVCTRLEGFEGTKTGALPTIVAERPIIDTFQTGI
jgi:hypothetical protein